MSCNCIGSIDILIKSKALPRIEKIDVSFNLISTLPDQFYKQARSLRSLDISHNMLSYISPDIQCLTYLDSLLLHSNCLSELPSSISLLPLKQLSIDWLTYRKPPSHHIMTDGRLKHFKDRLFRSDGGRMSISDIVDVSACTADGLIHGESLLYKAVERGDLAVVDMICRERKGALGMRDTEGMTLLGLAVRMEMQNSAFHLLKLGSDPKIGSQLVISDQKIRLIAKFGS